MNRGGHEVASVGGYRPEIDGLRMVAVVSVILYHAGVPGFSGGYVGVDIFFVISGFLITAIIARELTSDTFSFIDFYERRARRILPALFAMCAATMLVALLLLTPEQLRHYGQSQFATMTFAANVYFYFRSGYFTPDIHAIPLIHMWSLAVEEQFYVIFPIILLVIAKTTPRARNAIVATIFFASLYLSIRSQESWPLGNFYLVPFRAWELMAGGLVALYEPVIRRMCDSAPRTAQLASSIGLAALLVPIATYSDRTVFPGVNAIPVVFGTAAVIATTARGGIVRDLLAFKPFVWVGLASYSAYLWHQPLFAAVELWLQSRPPMVIRIGLIGVTFVVAWASLVLVERPFRDRRRVSRKMVFKFAAAGTAFFSITGLALHAMDGLPNRFPPAALAEARTMEVSPLREACHTEGLDYRKPDNACTFFKGPARWAVLGDSHGVELAYALGERLRLRESSVIQLTFSGCAPAYRIEVSNPGCSAWTRETVDWLGRQVGITDVVVAYRHLFYLYGDQLRTYPLAPDERPPLIGDVDKETARKLYWDSFDAQIRLLRSKGKRVWVVGPVPDLPTPVERYVFGRTSDSSQPVGVSMDWLDRRVSPTTDRVRAIALRNGAQFIDPSSSLCRGGECHWIANGQVLYFDDNHLSLPGARMIVDEQILARATR